MSAGGAVPAPPDAASRRVGDADRERPLPWGGLRGPLPWLVLLAVAGALLFHDLGARVLTNNDEARFPMLARGILAGDDWLLPHLRGGLYLNKPALFAWLIVAASRPVGAVTQTTAAIPSLVSALALVLVTAWTARRLFGAPAGLVAGLITPAMYGVFFLARVPLPDMTMGLMISAAMAAFVRAELDASRGALMLFYGLTGAGFWAKGPVGLLPIPIATVYCLATGGIRGLSRLVSRPGLALLAMIVVPWWALGALAGREQFAEGAVKTNFLHWYLPTMSRGLGHVWTPIKDGFTITLPWGLVLPPALVALWRRRGLDAAHDRRVTLVLVWAAVVLVAVGLSNEQRLRYYLPLCAPVALLLAAGYGRLQWPRRALAFALVWLVLAGGLVAAHVPLTRRQNARTDLRALQRVMRQSPAPLRAYGVPDLVFAFYLERPVEPLGAPPGPASFGAAAARGYVAIADRYLAAADGLGLRRVATGLADRKPFTVLARQ